MVQAGLTMDLQVASNSANTFKILFLYAAHVLLPAILLLRTHKDLFYGISRFRSHSGFYIELYMWHSC